ncbi:hypothetical protein OUZ56_030731 [Daphnia magna]|uniref:Uncharacterized protein n=1 Tax=Daphnia magna TaxID=35525 RepID=A0ABQ9ZTF7_9CRUS|nr:hypothetical protein OUZ56_030731 [Daphnia magna]
MNTFRVCLERKERRAVVVGLGGAQLFRIRGFKISSVDYVISIYGDSDFEGEKKNKCLVFNSLLLSLPLCTGPKSWRIFIQHLWAMREFDGGRRRGYDADFFFVSLLRPGWQLVGIKAVVMTMTVTIGGIEPHLNSCEWNS